MFILDSLFVSGLRWVLDKVATAVDGEMNDDSVLREELLAAEMRREMGEISEAEFRRVESDLLARIRAIRERREGGAGPIAFGRDEQEGDSPLQVEATVAGDFHAPPAGVSEDHPPRTDPDVAVRRRARRRRGGAPRPTPGPPRLARRPRSSR